MANLQSLNIDQPIVDPKTGKPTLYFMQLLLGKDGILSGTSEDVAAVQAALDSLSLDDLGDVEAPSPVDGEVLTYVGANSRWEAVAQSGGGGLSYELNTTSSTSTVATAGKGVFLKPLINATIEVVTQRIVVPSSVSQYRAYVLELDGSDQVTSILAQSGDVVPGSAGTQTVVFELTSSASLTAGGNYAVIVYLNSSTSTTSSGALTGGSGFSTFPNTGAAQTMYARQAAISPSVGDTITVASSSQYSIGLGFTLSL